MNNAEQVAILRDYGFNSDVALELVSNGQFVPIRRSDIRWATDAPPEAVPTPKRDSELLTIDEAAEYLNLTADQVRAFIADGELRYINVGRGKKRPRMRFTKADLNEFIERRARRDAPCQSTNTSGRHSISSISKSPVVGFAAARAAHLAKTPKNSKR
jgi:excisionase family DNA binding protein